MDPRAQPHLRAAVHAVVTSYDLGDNYLGSIYELSPQRASAFEPGNQDPYLTLPRSLPPSELQLLNLMNGVREQRWDAKGI